MGGGEDRTTISMANSSSVTKERITMTTSLEVFAVIESDLLNPVASRGGGAGGGG